MRKLHQCHEVVLRDTLQEAGVDEEATPMPRGRARRHSTASGISDDQWLITANDEQTANIAMRRPIYH